MVKKLNNFYEKSGKKKRFAMESETLGDGNCFYRAVINYFVPDVDGSTSSSHLELRRTVVAFVEEEFKKEPQSEEMQKEFICYTAAFYNVAILILKIEEDGTVREELIPSELNQESPVDQQHRIILAHQVKKNEILMKQSASHYLFTNRN